MPEKPASEVSSNIEIISAVKKRAYLYDRNDAKFADKTVRAEAWKEIGKGFGLSGEACQKAFVGLRDKYVRELKKVRLSNGPANSKWPYKDAMKFLDPHIVHHGKDSHVITPKHKPTPRRSTEPTENEPKVTNTTSSPSRSVVPNKKTTLATTPKVTKKLLVSLNKSTPRNWMVLNKKTAVTPTPTVADKVSSPTTRATPTLSSVLPNKKTTPTNKLKVAKIAAIKRKSLTKKKKMRSKKRTPVRKPLPVKKTAIVSSQPVSPVLRNKRRSASLEPSNPKKPRTEAEDSTAKEDYVVHDEADSVRGDNESNHGDDEAPREETSVSRGRDAVSRHPKSSSKTTEGPKQMKTIVDSLEELLSSSKQPHDAAYYFGMNVACRLRQMTRKNMSIAQAEIQYRLRQIELENDFS